MRYRLGKRPARKGAISIRFADVFDRAALPTPPGRFGHESIGRPWEMFANDRLSNCVWAGAAHEHMVWTHEGAGVTAAFSEAGVLADYAAATGWTAADPDSDQGTDMAAAASYRRRVGVVDAAGVRHRIDSYVALAAGDKDDLALAAWLSGAVGIGLMLPRGADAQFDHGVPWTVEAGASIEGGHYVPCIGRNSAGNFLVVTWGRIHAMTPAFYHAYSDEAVSYLALETIRAKTATTPEGFDESSLRSHLAKLATHH